jgi:hypothetical protein
MPQSVGLTQNYLNSFLGRVLFPMQQRRVPMVNRSN